MILSRYRRAFVITWIASCCHLAGDLGAADPQVTRTPDGGQQVEREGVTLLSLVGEPATLGHQAGMLLAAQTQVMLTALSLHPAMAGMVRDGERAAALAATVPQDYRDELTAWATAATCDPAALLRANLAVDVLCTAVVRLPDATAGRPLMVARNMDFAPAHLLGRKTVLIARRPNGRRASLSIGWPGYVGVVSGMNDAGVSACLLLNHAAKGARAGDSLGFRLRTILDHAGTLDEAVAAFSAAPVASSNYVLLADVDSAAVVWWEDGAMKRVDPTAGWVLCTNARIDDDSRRPEDARGRRAGELTRLRRNPTLDWMKQLLTATYMPEINAQAMVLIPQTRSVHLATFTARAAALSPWRAIEAGPLMAGADLATLPLTASPAVAEPFAHYAGAH